ncbi:hypothetical protein CANMA_002646 [Candida margitis]|uniref:uncharacterized protein n=1 Tax=Candida margitis TaxID=1775924 RepID=UPI002226228F|nr:uncharacterized protein CANMA_002646 [Candida margitis]KAI5967878.1 hypothetical protein CANMA_002646 [Candida margitis]
MFRRSIPSSILLNIKFSPKIYTKSFSSTTKILIQNPFHAKSFKSSDSNVDTDELISENNPWSPTLEDDPIFIQERHKITKTQLPEYYRLSYNPIYEAPAAKYVSILKRLTLSFGVVGLYGSKLIYESTQFDDSFAYTLLAGTIIPIILVQWKTKDYVTRIFRLYNKTIPQTLDNLVKDENLIVEKLNFTGGKTYNELLKITDNKSLIISPEHKFWKPYTTWEDKSNGQENGSKREFYIVDDIGGIKMDRLWGVVEKNSGINNGRSFFEPSSHNSIHWQLKVTFCFIDPESLTINAVMSEEDTDKEPVRIPEPPLEGKILKRDKYLDDKGESETARNTRLNASLYHTSDESIQQYRQQNDSTDLLGRLYYDDFDSNSNLLSPELLSPAASLPHSPIISPMPTGGGGAGNGGDDEFYLGTSSTSPTLKNAILNSHLSSSSTSLSSLPKLALSKNNRPNLSRGVSFDTGDGGPKKSFTLKIKHPEYKFRRNNKTWLVGFNNDVESTKAVEWLFDEMVIHGDTIVVLQVLNEKKYTSIDKKQANANLSTFEQLNVHFKKVALLFEVVIGKPEKSLKQAIKEYAPSMMVIGTRHFSERDHHSHHRGFLSKSSLSKHFLECALVPVIIVKPTYNYIENLSHPIDSEQYFANWLKRTSKDHEMSDDQLLQSNQQNSNHSSSLHRKVNSFLSPTSSRNSSYTNLVNEERGRSSLQNPVQKLANESRSRSTSRTRSAFSKIFRKHDD